MAIDTVCDDISLTFLCYLLGISIYMGFSNKISTSFYFIEICCCNCIFFASFMKEPWRDG